MKHKTILLITAFFVIVSTAFAADKMILHIEIRSQKSASFDTNTGLQFVTDTTSESCLLSRAKQQVDDNFRIFQKSYNLLARERRRAIVIYTHSAPKNQPQQVFLLSIPRKPKLTDWTIWQRPDYVETDADWNFIRGYTSADRSTNIPHSFELRYKVERASF